MKINPKKLAKKLGGDVNGKWINIPGPGHSKYDRSLGIIFDPSARNGFRVNSHSYDNWKKCMEHVKKLMLDNGYTLPIGVSLDKEASPKTNAKSKADALAIWHEAQP